MKISIVRDLPEDVWRSFVDDNPLGNIFHTPEMHKVFSKTKGYVPELWAAVDEGGLPLALLLPVKISVFGGWLRQLTTRAVVFGSVLWLPGEAGIEALTLLLKSYGQETEGTPIFTELRNLTDLKAIQPLLGESGFLYEDHLNYLIDLDLSPEAVLENFKSRTRKDVRHVIRGGQVIVDELNQTERLKSWYDILRKTYQAAQSPVSGYFAL